MKIFSLVLLVFSILFLTACDNSQKETGTSLFDDLTSTSDYTEYQSVRNSINNPLMVFGKITSWKNGSEYAVSGARVLLNSKDSAVTDINGNYYIRNIHLTVNDSGEVSQENATISVLQHLEKFFLVDGYMIDYTDMKQNNIHNMNIL